MQYELENGFWRVSAIAGIAKPGCVGDVATMLDMVPRQGHSNMRVMEVDDVCIGAIYSTGRQTRETLGYATPLTLHAGQLPGQLTGKLFGHGVAGNPDQTQGQTTCQTAAGQATLGQMQAQVIQAPLYYGTRSDGSMCFASDPKALSAMAEEVFEFLPGETQESIVIEPMSSLAVAPREHRFSLMKKLEAAIARCVPKKGVGSLLTGGLDPRALGTLTRPFIHTLHCFVHSLQKAERRITRRKR